MGKLVFLGGTCGGNDWRKAFTAKLIDGGVSKDSIFDPVVPDWNEAAAAAEAKAKADASHVLYYIASPKQEGNPISAYSMVEATMALYDRPTTAVVVFDLEGLDKHPLKATKQTLKDLKARFPEGNIFGTSDEALTFLTAALK